MGGSKPLRRNFLAGGAALLGGTVGIAAGYVKREQITQLRQDLTGAPEESAVPVKREFARQAAAIREAQARQTVETIRGLKATWEAPVFGKVRVWDLVEKLGLCIDPSDDTLMLTSQYVHVQQILEGMERDGVEERDLYLIALLHDLGKAMLLTAEVPEHIVGFTTPLGEYPAGVGLDNVLFQFGHDEMIYSRLKDHVPEHIAWSIRYHSVKAGSVEKYLNARERTFEERYLAKFRVYDQGSKSFAHLPRLDMAKYRAMIEDHFPKPILI